jgi:sugar lactone lactonase YvrE
MIWEVATSSFEASPPAQPPSVFFVDAWNAQLVSLNIHSGVMSRTFAGNVPEGVTVSPDGERAYVALSFENAVSEFDAKSITSGALRTIPVGSRPVGLAMNPRGNRLYVTNALGHSVTCIDLSASPVATYSVSLINAAHPTPRPLGIATNASGTRAYVSLGASNANIAVLDITELQPRFIADIPTESSSMSLGDTRLGIATNPAADLFYAVAPGRDRLTLPRRHATGYWPLRSHLRGRIPGWHFGRRHRQSGSGSGRRDLSRRSKQCSPLRLRGTNGRTAVDFENW